MSPSSLGDDDTEAKSLYEEILYRCPTGTPRAEVEALLKENSFVIKPVLELQSGADLYAERVRKVSSMSGRRWQVNAWFDDAGGLDRVETHSNLIAPGLFSRY